MTIFGLREAFGIPTAPRWRRIVASMVLGANDNDEISRVALDKVIVASTATIPANEMRAVLIRLGVIHETKAGVKINHACADRISAALEILDAEGDAEADTWHCVATLPRGFQRSAVPTDIIVTKACVLRLVESASKELWLTTPYMDYEAIDFLEEPLAAALQRNVSLKVLTATCNAEFVEKFIEKLGASGPLENLAIWEASTLSSLLGTHAKAIVADRVSAYLGSANLTAYGLDRHFELGVQLDGPRVAQIAQILEAISNVGSCRFGTIA